MMEWLRLNVGALTFIFGAISFIFTFLILLMASVVEYQTKDKFDAIYNRLAGLENYNNGASKNFENTDAWIKDIVPRLNKLEANQPIKVIETPPLKQSQ